MSATQPSNGKSVVVGISGGVDSSVTAYLLQQQGYDVSGLFMKNWDEDDGAEECSILEDYQDAQSVCDRLGIPLNTINFATEYWDRVFETFLRDLSLGRTPNPDILCNREIKFREFFQWAEQLGADYVATGHYARTAYRQDHWRLLRGLDTNKDQSYFLHSINPQVLSRVLFPIGELKKNTVRDIAAELGLVTHDKKDSTGICFIGERRFREFVARYLPMNNGDIESPEGKRIGEHQGLAGYTLGQRHGLGIGGAGEAWYVSGKDLSRNVLIAVQGHDHPALFASALRSEPIDWIHAPDKDEFTCTAKTRYRQQDSECVVTCQADGVVDVIFNEPQRAMTPGQSVVFYQGDECLGGGVIDRVGQTAHDNPIITANESVELIAS